MATNFEVVQAQRRVGDVGRHDQLRLFDLRLCLRYLHPGAGEIRLRLALSDWIIEVQPQRPGGRRETAKASQRVEVSPGDDIGDCAADCLTLLQRTVTPLQVIRADEVQV